jgi:hypothetical protein
MHAPDAFRSPPTLHTIDFEGTEMSDHMVRSNNRQHVVYEAVESTIEDDRMRHKDEDEWSGKVTGHRPPMGKPFFSKSYTTVSSQCGIK